MKVPIACTLTADGADGRVEEWRRFLATSVAEVERVSDQRLRVRLQPGADVLVAAVDLAQREKSCCSFFEFSVEVEQHERWLVIGVPPEARDVLADFAGLVPEHLRRQVG